MGRASAATRGLLLLAGALLLARGARAQGGGDIESALAARLSRPVRQVPCVRLLGATRDVGCSTGPAGVTAWLYLADTPADVAAFAQLDGRFPRAVVLPPALLSPGVLDALSAAAHFAGVLVTSGPLSPGGSGGGFSPASAVLPDAAAGGGGGGSWAWNPAGRNLTAQRFRFPLVYLPTADESGAMRSLAAANRDGGAVGGGGGGGGGPYAAFPQHAVSLYFPMGPEGLTSPQCLAASQCLPLGGQSVWGSLGALDAAPTLQPPRPSRSPAASQRPVVMAVAALDAGGLFHDVAWGADATLSGLVALLGAAEALGRTPGVDALPAQLLFGAFQGEAWGALGSRRWLGELAGGGVALGGGGGGFNCTGPVSAAASATGVAFCAAPLRTSLQFTALAPADVVAVVAADQVGGARALYAHEWRAAGGGAPLDPAPGPLAAVAAAVFANASVAGLLAPLASLAAASAGPPPPPGPLGSFVRAAAGDSSSGGGGTGWPLRGLLLGGYDAAFATRVYHSQFDNASNVDVAAVAASATLLARTLWALAAAPNGSSPPAVAAAAVPPALAANASLVAALFGCLAVNAQCPLFGALLGLGTSPSALAAFLPAGPLSLYPSVYSQPYLVGATGYALAPSPIEAFSRNFLALALAGRVGASLAGGAGAPAAGGGGGCNASAPCALPAECLAGVCVNATAYYHDALSRAVAPATSGVYGAFAVNASLLTPSDPAWAEPYWSARIGATVFLKDAPAAEAAALAGGVAVCVASLAAAWALVRFLDTHYKVA